MISGSGSATSISFFLIIDTLTPLQQIGMILAHPSTHFIANCDRELAYLGGIRIGNDTNPLVASDVPLLPERVEGRHETSVHTDRLAQGLYDSKMMLVPRRSIAGRRKCHRRRL